jgi:hypothetical protein
MRLPLSTPSPRVFLLLALPLAALAIYGCSKNKNVAEASRGKAVELIAQVPAAEATPHDGVAPSAVPDGTNAPAPAGVAHEQTGASRPVRERRLYIDASKSMTGFAGHGGNFDRFLSEIGYALSDPLVYKFGSQSRAPAPKYNELIRPAALGQEQKSPGFYNLMNNPDDVLFAELSRDGRNSLSVYVSDGVYSASDAKAGSKVITPLLEWLADGRVLGIFVLRSRFKGSFYTEKLCSETRGQECWLPEVDVPRRAFYAFVFSPDEETFRNLQRELEAKFDDMRTLIFSDKAVALEELDLPEDESIYDSGKQPEGYYWQMFTTRLFGTQNPAHLSFALPYVVDGEYPLGKISPRVAAKYYLWDEARGGFAESDPPPGFKTLSPEDGPAQLPLAGEVSTRTEGVGEAAPPGVRGAALVAGAFQLGPGKQEPPRSSKPAPPRDDRRRPDESMPKAAPPASSPSPASPDAGGTQTARFRLQIPRDPRGFYGLYHLRIGIEVDTVSAFVEGLSTDDDSTAAQADRTYRFAQVIKALLGAHLRGRLASRLTPPLFLTISN